MHNPIPSRLFIILIAIHFIHCGCPGKPAPDPSVPPQNSSGSITSSSSTLSPPSSAPPPPPVLTPITDDMIKKVETVINARGKRFQILYDKLTNLKAGINTAIDDKSSLTETALCVAAIVGDISITQALLDRNADINAIDNKQLTPMHLAILYNSLDAALLLIKTGKIDKANLEAKVIGAQTQTALEYVTERKGQSFPEEPWQAIIDALRAAGAEE